MILSPSRRLWNPADGCSWLNWFTAGKQQRGSSGKLKRNSSTGKMRTNSASVTTCCCTATTYRVRKCCTSAYVNYEITPPSVPYYFEYDVGSGVECLYVTSGSTVVTPGTYTTISTSGLATYASCAACYDCSECKSATDCTYCSRCSTNSTPDTWTATFSGVTSDTSCLVCSGGQGPCFTAEFAQSVQLLSSWSGGTYTLTQVSACEWTYTSSGTYAKAWNNTDCTGTEYTYDGFKVRLTRGASGWSVRVFLTTSTHSSCIDGPTLFLTGSPFSMDCCEGTTSAISSTIGSGNIGCNPALYVESSIHAYGGSASFTPC